MRVRLLLQLWLGVLPPVHARQLGHAADFIEGTARGSSPLRAPPRRPHAPWPVTSDVSAQAPSNREKAARRLMPLLARRTVGGTVADPDGVLWSVGAIGKIGTALGR